LTALLRKTTIRQDEQLSRSGGDTHKVQQIMSAMNTQMKATWRKMVGTALLWAAFATLIYVTSSGGGARAVIVACLGFVSFASGLALFADGLKRDIVEQLRRDRNDHAA
jgi:hypothetical protein